MTQNAILLGNLTVEGAAQLLLDEGLSLEDLQLQTELIHAGLLHAEETENPLYQTVDQFLLAIRNRTANVGQFKRELDRVLREQTPQQLWKKLQAQGRWFRASVGHLRLAPRVNPLAGPWARIRDPQDNERGTLIDLKHPINRLRVALWAKFGYPFLRGTSVDFSDFKKGGNPENMEAYLVVPFVDFDPVVWMGRLRATFYAALDRSYGHAGWELAYAEIGDRPKRNIAIRLYKDSNKLFLSLPLVTFEHSPHRAMLEGAHVNGEIVQTFMETIVQRSGNIERFFEFLPTPSDLRQAEREVRAHFAKNQWLKEARFLYLVTRRMLKEKVAERGRFEEAILMARAINDYTLEGQLRRKRDKFEVLPRYARANYDEAIDRSFGWRQRPRCQETTTMQNFQPELFLLNHFLAPILWRKFLRKLFHLLEPEILALEAGKPK